MSYYDQLEGHYRLEVMEEQLIQGVDTIMNLASLISVRSRHLITVYDIGCSDIILD